MSNIFLLLLLVVLATLVPYLMSKEPKQHESENQVVQVEYLVDNPHSIWSRIGVFLLFVLTLGAMCLVVFHYISNFS